MQQLQEQATGSKFKAFTSELFKTISIPYPPHEVQREIVAACEAVDEEYSRIRMSIEEYKSKIEKLFNNIEIITVGGVRLDDSTLFEVSIGKRVVETEFISMVKFLYIALMCSDHLGTSINCSLLSFMFHLCYGVSTVIGR